jgi:hypothetical protein
VRRLAPVALAAALLTGCGGKSAPVGDAAQLVPASARAYAVVAPPGGERSLEQRSLLAWRYAHELRGRFGVRAPVVAGVPLGIARLPSGTVAFARPGDPERFARRLAGFVHTTMGGWVVFARTKAPIDAVRHRRATLAEQPGFQAALRALPAHASYWAYAPGWTAAAILVKGHTLTCELATGHPADRNIDTSALARRVPARAVVAFAGSPETVPARGFAALDPVARFLSLDLRALVAGLDGPFAAWAAPGEPIPEVTIVARPRRPVRALRAVRRAVGRMAGAGPARELDLGPLSVATTLAHRELVVSDVAEPLAGPGRLRPRGLPDATEWWLSIDAVRAVAGARALLALANAALPQAVADLASVRSVLAYARRAGATETTVASFEVP